MINPNETVSRALMNLENNQNFQAIIEWIDESLKTQAIGNCKLSGEIAIKGQGRCLELIELLKHFGKASIYMDNAKEAARLEKK